MVCCRLWALLIYSSYCNISGRKTDLYNLLYITNECYVCILLLYMHIIIKLSQLDIQLIRRWA